ncbi:MAG: hypothetical protein CSA58_02920 [Micrococcales bacterium]|nr:MAG: hypothetical protein CSB46_02765 [Micrococcales bacterium]PIE27686.1 MAG: hypothetical protein CSA58_02920 [Micrococcales bacterium]
MPGSTYEYDNPERVVIGTVGEPGSRSFFLQVRGARSGWPGTSVTSVSLEKQQVAVLADRMEDMLDEVLRRSGGSAAVPAIAPLGQDDLDPLDPPEEDFRVGTMSLGWDAERELVTIECYATLDTDFTEDDPNVDEETTPGTGGDRSVLRVSMDGATARLFVRRSEAVVAAGRPPCPFCHLPLDPDGHICPRSNGYRR